MLLLSVIFKMTDYLLKIEYSFGQIVNTYSSSKQFSMCGVPGRSNELCVLELLSLASVWLSY